MSLIMAQKPFYQLTTKNGRPTFYTFFDNMDDANRLHIRVMIYHLNAEEYVKITKEINLLHGKQSIDANEPLEFMKYVIIHHKGEVTAVDMDTLRFVVPPQDSGSLSKSLVKMKPHQGEKIPLLKSKSKITQGPSLHHGDSTQKRGKLRFETVKHGTVSLTFNKYADPNVRNGVQISIAKNVNKSSMYGALVYATHPKFLLLKNASILPKIPTKKKIEEMKQSQYWVRDETPKKYMNQKNDDVILIPKGKVVKSNIDTF